MKYILIENPNGIKTAITFPEHITHKNMARYVKSVGCAVSAGMYDPCTHQTTGASDTLKLFSRPVDAGYIMFGSAVRAAQEHTVERMLTRWRERNAAYCHQTGGET